MPVRVGQHIRALAGVRPANDIEGNGNAGSGSAIGGYGCMNRIREADDIGDECGHQGAIDNDRRAVSRVVKNLAEASGVELVDDAVVGVRGRPAVGEGVDIAGGASQFHIACAGIVENVLTR